MLDDKNKTTFTMQWGTYCYVINAGATYQRVMVVLFHDMIHKEIEIYIDDMEAKTPKVGVM